MPRPPILPTLDWKAILESGVNFDTWIGKDESPENCGRMREILHGITLDALDLAVLKHLPRQVYICAIAEDWCGDVVRHVPCLQALVAASPNVELRFITREQYPDVFVRFLTNGGEAIPKFVFISETYVECDNWGPMPAACRELIARGKACGDVGAARQKTGKLYEADHDYRVVLDELLHLIQLAACSKP